MSESTQAMRARRARREPPRRRPGMAAPAPVPEPSDEPLVKEAADAKPVSLAEPPTARAVPPRRPEGPAATAPSSANAASAPSRLREPPPLGPDDPIANLAVRTRRPLDEALAGTVGGLLYEQGVRTSKVELIELLLWELAADDLGDLGTRLARYRSIAPRRPPL